MNGNCTKNGTVIASDHRLARVTEAIGFNTTLDGASIIWISENVTDYMDELKGIGKNYSKITHIIIDDTYLPPKLFHPSYYSTY